MIFDKKDYIAPGIIRTLLLQSYFSLTGPWKKLSRDYLESRNATLPLQKFNIPIFSRPKNSLHKCSSCSQCLEVCPTQCLSMFSSGGSGKTDEECKVVSFKINLLNCISCSKCAEICPEKILVMRDAGVGPGPAESEWNLELIGFHLAKTADKSE